MKKQLKFLLAGLLLFAIAPLSHLNAVSAVSQEQMAAGLNQKLENNESVNSLKSNPKFEKRFERLTKKLKRKIEKRGVAVDSLGDRGGNGFIWAGVIFLIAAVALYFFASSEIAIAIGVLGIICLLIALLIKAIIGTEGGGFMM